MSVAKVYRKLLRDKFNMARTIHKFDVDHGHVQSRAAVWFMDQAETVVMRGVYESVLAGTISSSEFLEITRLRDDLAQQLENL